LILYDHHQSRIVVAALFSQLLDCALGIRKVPPLHPAGICQQDHPRPVPARVSQRNIAASNFLQLTLACQIKGDRKGSFVDLDQIRSGAAASGVMS
jgi:hypothetical protein